MPHRVALRCKGRSVAMCVVAFTKTDRRRAMNSTPWRHWVWSMRLAIVLVCVMACGRLPSCKIPSCKKRLNQLEQVGVRRFKLGKAGGLELVPHLCQIDAQRVDAGQLRMRCADVFVERARYLTMISECG
ncbi:MAG: hypothetical protein RIQ55_877 [Pseudomonadota bacterium]